MNKFFKQLYTPDTTILIPESIRKKKRFKQSSTMKYHASAIKNICFTVLYSSGEYRIQTYVGEYRDLKCLIMDRLFADDFGQCGGMGRCGTCIVKIGGLNEASGFLRNEATTLQRIAPGIDDIRLACQIPVDECLSNVIITVI